jgi:hypothetical protein
VDVVMSSAMWTPRLVVMCERHCRARVEHGQDPRGSGRCVYPRGHTGEHALLRKGGLLMRWSTQWTNVTTSERMAPERA